MLHLNSSGDATCLYVSKLAPGVTFEAVQRIVHVSRQRNALLGIRGALVFDSTRFGQLLVGRPVAVATLASRITQDVRHTAVCWLHAGPALPLAAVTDWRSGYCGTTDLDAVLGAAERAGGEAAVQAFLDLVNGAMTE